MNQHLNPKVTQELKPMVILGLVLVALLGLSFVVESLNSRRDEVSVPTEVAVSPFDRVELTAKAAYVYDARTKEVLYEKNADMRLPLASLTKVMSALVATELTPGYSTVVVGSDALSATGDSGFYAGERWSLKSLLDFSLASSSNDGMRAVAIALGALSSTTATAEESTTDFVREMNKKAEELDMKNTYYFNETGLDESDIKGGAYGTARDMAKLFEYVLRTRPELMEATRDNSVTVSSLDSYVHTARNTGIIVDEVPGIKASKTGFTDIAGGNLVIAFDPELGRPIIVAVLGSTGSDRFQDVLELVDATMKSLSQNN